MNAENDIAAKRSELIRAASQYWAAHSFRKDNESLPDADMFKQFFQELVENKEQELLVRAIQYMDFVTSQPLSK